MNLSSLTPSEAHRVVVNWVRVNHLKFPYQKEIVLRDAMVDFASATGRKDASKFADWLAGNFPKFFEDVVLGSGK